MELFLLNVGRRRDCDINCHFLMRWPKQSATKMLTASEIAAYLTVFLCSKIAANLTNFATAASKIDVNLTAFAVANLHDRFCCSKIAAATCNMTDFAAVKLLLTTVFDAANLLLI